MNCECPICFDAIEGNKNKVITECGHCFHTNCLMTSVAHNGFGCPYCRTEMAKEVNDIDESEYDDDEEEEELYDDDVLRGFRLFMANIEDEEQDVEDVAQEQYEEQIREAAEERERDHELDNAAVPTPEYLAQKLVEQGVGMIDLVKVLLLGHDEFFDRSEEFDRLDGEMYGKLRAIISNYER